MKLDRRASAQQRMMEAIRRHFRDMGGSPTQRQLAIACGMRPNDVGRVLRQLSARGQIILRIGVRRGIALPVALDMASDAELDLAVHARGARIVWPEPLVAPLAIAFRVEPDTSCGLTMADLLAQIDDANRSGTVDDAPADRGG